MFLGHFAVGLAAKRISPRISLAMLFAAAQFADLLWPVLVAFGIEQVAIEPGLTRVTPLNFISYPYSHSLVFLVVWGVLLALAHRPIGADRAIPVIAGLVVSHWVLDFVTHRPDMPIYPGSEKFGLGLWNSLPGTLLVELPMFAVGVWVYARVTRAGDRFGTWAFITLVVFLTAVSLGNLFSPPPPSVGAIYSAGLIGGLVLLVWAWWVDRHRTLRNASLREPPAVR